LSKQQTFPQEQVVGSGPIGQGNHVVREGECMSSLAAQKGLFVDQIFEHPANAQLSTVRGDPNILLPGDRVTIPQFALKDVDRATEQRNRFVLQGEPVFLRIQVMDRDKPLGGEPFTLAVGGVTIQDTTQADGTIETRIPPDATTGILRVGTGADLIQLTLKLGALSPVANAKGVQQRLQNLGFDCGPIDGIVGPRTRGAVRNFQAKFGLPPDGILGPQTRELLKEKHGC
jgi:Putative peptidoglycan binding domain